MKRIENGEGIIQKELITIPKIKARAREFFENAKKSPDIRIDDYGTRGRKTAYAFLLGKEVAYMSEDGMEGSKDYNFSCSFDGSILGVDCKFVFDQKPNPSDRGGKEMIKMSIIYDVKSRFPNERQLSELDNNDIEKIVKAFGFKETSKKKENTKKTGRTDIVF